MTNCVLCERRKQRAEREKLARVTFYWLAALSLSLCALSWPRGMQMRELLQPVESSLVDLRRVDVSRAEPSRPLEPSWRVASKQASANSLPSWKRRKQATRKPKATLAKSRGPFVIERGGCESIALARSLFRLAPAFIVISAKCRAAPQFDRPL